MALPPRKKPPNVAKVTYPVDEVKFCSDCKFRKFVDHYSYVGLNGEPILFECKEKPFKFQRKEKGCDKWMENKG